MPKKSNSVTKSQRIDALRKILSRWGRLNKESINQKLCAQLGIDEELVNRTIYRDLNELVDNHELEVFYKSRDGKEINEYDPEVNKNVICEWAPIGNENNVIGQDLLSKNGAQLFASDRLAKLIKVTSAETEIDLKSYHLFFNIPNQFICLKILKEALPFSIIIGRIPTTTFQPRGIFSELEKIHGRRVIMISLPENSISSFQPTKEKFGHTILRFDESDVIIEDLNSKNKTFFCKLSQKEAEQVRSIGLNANQKTITLGIDKLMKSDVQIKIIEVKNEFEIGIPFLFFLGERVPVLIV